MLDVGVDVFGITVNTDDDVAFASPQHLTMSSVYMRHWANGVKDQAVVDIVQGDLQKVPRAPPENTPRGQEDSPGLLRQSPALDVSADQNSVQEESTKAREGSALKRVFFRAAPKRACAKTE